MVCENLRQMNHTVAVESDIRKARGRLNERLSVLFALVVMTAIATLPFFVIGEDQKVGCCGGEMPVTHDSWMHLNQMRAFYRGLEAGRLYPRWDDETHGGYGAPTLAFYPPGAYYVTSFFYFLTRDWSKVWIGFYWLASFASAAAIYYYAIRMKRRRRLLIIGCALGFGLMIAAAYFLPAVAEQNLVNYDDVERTWPYHASYVYDFAQKVYDHAMDSFFSRLDRIWAFNALAILLLGGAVLNGTYRSYESYKPDSGPIPDSVLRKRVWLWAWAGLIASFLMTKYSKPIGRLIPKIETGVYSWRMMALTSFAMALLAGACFEVRSTAFWRKRLNHQALPPEGDTTNSPPKGGTTNLAPLVASLMILIAALAASAWYVAWPMWRAQSFEPNPEHYNYATLPRGAPREAPPMDRAQLASSNGRVTVEYWAPELRRLRVEAPKPDQLQFRTSNFAGWTAIVDGGLTEIKEGAVKNIVIDAPEGEHAVTLELRSTPVRRAGNVITIFSLALLFSITIAAIRLK